MPEVLQVSGMLQGFVQAEGNPLFFVFGYPLDSFVLSRFQIVSGSDPQAGRRSPLAASRSGWDRRPPRCCTKVPVRLCAWAAALIGLLGFTRPETPLKTAAHCYPCQTPRICWENRAR
jgi:hypothetical protein